MILVYEFSSFIKFNILSRNLLIFNVCTAYSYKCRVKSLLIACPICCCLFKKKETSQAKQIFLYYVYLFDGKQNARELTYPRKSQYYKIIVVK